VIADPEARGAALARFHLAVAPRLAADLADSGAVPAGAAAADEWECLAVHASVRGLVAASGFGAATALAVDAFHRAVLEAWMEASPSLEAFDARRLRLADRHAEYGAIGLDEPAGDAHRRLGEAAARHAGAPDAPDLAALLAALHEALAEGAAEAVRRGAEPA
jgi:hypothetical protein